MASKLVVLALRGSEFLWTLLIMALVGNMIASAFAGNPSIVNFDMFIAVFSMLSLFYLLPVAIMGLEFPALWSLILDALNTLLFFLGGVITAALLGAHNCNDKSYTLHNNITNGSSDMEGRCREAQASTAFLWFGFASYAASTVLSFANRGRSSLGSVGPRPTAMSQV